MNRSIARHIWYFCLDPHISSGSEHYAPSIHTMETINALRAHGNEVQAFFEGDRINAKDSAIHQTYHKLDGKNRFLRWTKSALRDSFELYQNIPGRLLVEQIFRRNSIDLIYERLAQNKSVVSACARKYQVPLIVESNAPADERRQYWGAPFYFITQRLEESVLKHADAAIVVSTPLKRHYEKLGIRSEKIFVLPNGINENRFSPESVSRDIRSELKLDGKVVVGFVGNIHKYHGIDLLVPLAQAFCSSGRNDIHFLIVGGESAFNLRRSSLMSEGLDRIFTFVDSIPNCEVPNYIAAMDICLLPQFMWYGSPMKILEYGAMGKAIIAPNLENIRDILTHGETAFLFEPGNMSDLCWSLQELVSDRQLRMELGNAARGHILANHTWARNAERIMEIYHWINFGSP